MVATGRLRTSFASLRSGLAGRAWMGRWLEEVVQVLREGGCVGVAAVGVLLEGVQADGLKVPWDLRADLPWGGRVEMEDLVVDGLGRAGVEGPAPHQQLVHRDAEAEHVGPGVKVLRLSHLFG